MYWLGSNLPCLLFFLKTWHEVAVPVSVLNIFSRVLCDFSFLAEPVLFIFLFCLAYSNFLTLDSGCEGLGVGCFVSFDLSNVY